MILRIWCGCAQNTPSFWWCQYFQGEEVSGLKLKITELEGELKSEKNGYEQLLEKVWSNGLLDHVSFDSQNILLWFIR